VEPLRIVVLARRVADTAGAAARDSAPPPEPMPIAF
jgi:hypothetical protein